MAGKPTVPPDAAQRPDVHGAALPPPGLADALDEERAASMADEGGRSGAYVERQDAPPLAPRRPWYRQLRPWLALGAAVAGVIMTLVRPPRRRPRRYFTRLAAR